MEAGSILLYGFNNDDNELFESAVAHSELPKGVTDDQLSKVWRVSNEVAPRTLYVTTQLNKQDSDSNLSCHFSTNYRMLRYKRLTYLFYTNTFYATQVISK